MDAVAEIKARLSIEDVISEYVQLKRAGKNYKGLSPFTNEKTPSFVVSPDKQIWHDFSSGRGGDVFSFVMEAEGVDFRGALELLARKAGVDLEQYQSKRSRGPKKERLYEILDTATKFYQVQLSANREALEYVRKKRQFSKETLLEFRLGYSPDGGTALKEYLTKKGFDESELNATGLLSSRGSDMFRGRIMVPLADPFGRVTGFTARLLRDIPNAPKYMNTPATPLYDKSRHIYGLHLAKKAIQADKFAVMVEGNLDVIASHQAGVKNVVATAGTALTEFQLKALGRLTPDVRLAFDEDRAGVEATERAIPLASKARVELSVITIPSGKDPDELVRQDPEQWRSAIQSSVYALDWLIKMYSSRLDLSSATGKRQFSDVTLRVVRSLSDSVEQDHYITKLAEILGVGADSLRSKLRSDKDAPKRLKQAQKAAAPDLTKAQIEAEKATDYLLGLALMLPGTRGYLDHVEVDMLTRDQAKLLLEFLKKNPEFDGNVKDYTELKEITDYVKIVSLQFEELYASVDTLELQYEAARLRTKVIEYYIKDQKTKLAQKLTDADGADATALLERARELDQLLYIIQEL